MTVHGASGYISIYARPPPKGKVGFSDRAGQEGVPDRSTLLFLYLRLGPPRKNGLPGALAALLWGHFSSPGRATLLPALSAQCDRRWILSFTHGREYTRPLTKSQEKALDIT